MTRAIILVMDSVGIGETADADEYGDIGANTLGHIAEACAEGQADSLERQGELKLPNLARLGLGKALLASSKKFHVGLNTSNESIIGSYGYAAEISKGKDTPSGHWEMAGLPVIFDWGVFPQTIPAFPVDFIEQFVEEAGILGILGDKHASGTDILVELGDEHIRTGKPICYTSTDSVFQIAAHEEHFGLERLYHVCEVAKRLTLPLEIGRVIARPFVGDSPENYKRTGNRHDYTTLPHGPTLLDHVIDTGSDVFSVGKIADVFAEQGISKKLKANGNMALFDATLEAMSQAKNGDLVFSNFVDFDSLYGHRRDITGYATALEAFDKRLPELLDKLQDDDLLLITADHGCDPSLPGTDHTREHVPVLFYSKKHTSRDLGKRQNFADMGQTIATHLGLKPLNYGTDCFKG